ncbi:Glycoside hydrolase, family 3, N-terminal domain protein [uncultured Pleomorphomonas sp.]|uniref:Glycoside hydrolase, family 3, N-terminal domain protein n=1 Tax=uncultured Pleomorphomonas sp. TaxID=442121 RepID=A0A212LHZ9_9HYPH|nr:glycoside hydrolase family 3 C-terminal domain-containing protein [uncultured Pleomorphomonas sp.]SCM77120.1 Glycoside hydrolase, family 3, N-terminal domain protein [uncultured Pleomorphomonas sp.]
MSQAAGQSDFATTSAATPPSPFDDAVVRVRAGAAGDTVARELYGRLTGPERLALLHGDIPFWPGRAGIMQHGYNHIPYPMGSNARLGIPGIRFIDGPRGVVVGHATAFPVSMARGASWDVALEEEIGRAIGLELRASGGNLFGGVCINLPRHPAWGRTQETYSDQPILIGEMGAALVRGVSGNAMACVKHFALNSMENARFDVDVRCAPEAMHEDYLPHFRRALAAGASAVMCAYNRVNGDWASASRPLLTEVLRDEWGFDGFVLSDFIWAIRDAAASLEAGLDLEAPFAQLRADRLPAALAAGDTTWERVEQSGLRLIATQLRHHASRDAAEPDVSIIAGPEHVALARRAARQSMVLLRNEAVDGAPVLPLERAKLVSLAVVGRLADLPNLGDHGSSNVHAPAVVTPLEGLRAALPEAAVLHDDGTDPAGAAALAAGATAAVVVVGYTAAEEGEWVNGRVYARDDLMALYPEPRDDAERAVLATMLERVRAAEGRPEIGGDRRDLRLPAGDVALIRAVAAANPRTVVVVVTAGAVILSDWHEEVPALVIGWYAGMQGGHALADLITGRQNFCGRLPYAIAASADDLPGFDIDAREITYDRWYGQRKLARDGRAATYPLGFGLSYTRFAIDRAGVTMRDGDALTLAVAVANTGDRAGRANIQIYATRTDGDRAGERELIGFGLVDLAAGDAAEVAITASLQPLARWDEAERTFRLPAGEVLIEAGRHWGDPAAATTTTRL